MSKIFSALGAFFSQVAHATIFAALGCVLLFSGAAQAHIIPVLTSGPTLLSPGQYQYTYRLDVSSDERLDPPATNGVTCPGSSGTKVLCSPAGTFVTIYDIPGLITASPAPGSGFSISTSPLGPTPSLISGLVDDPNLANVTFTYTGAVVNGPASFPGFTIVTAFGGINASGNYCDQATKNTGTSAGDTDQGIGPVSVPTATTAASVTVGGRVTTPGGRGIRGVIVTMTDTNGNVRMATTTSFGYFHFADVAAGETYVFAARAKRFTFTQSSQVLNINEDTEGVNFTGTTVTW